MASGLFNKANGIRFASESRDVCLPIGQRPTEESRRNFFRLLATRKPAGNAGNELVASYRRAFLR